MELVKKGFITIVSLILVVSIIFSFKLVLVDGIARDKILYKASGSDNLKVTQNINDTKVNEYNETTIKSENSEDKIEVNISEIKDTKYLVLVNHDYSTEEVEQSLLKKTKNGLHEVREDIYEDVLAFMDFAYNKGYDSFINSSYRTIESQRKAYDSATEEERKYLAKPGHSEHHTGLAVDILPMAETTGDKELTKETFDYLKKIADEYGFILRYPDGKEEITKIKYEYWHFRYVGIPHAKFIHDNDIVLEEYLEYIKNNDHLVVETKDGTFKIYYAKVNNDKVFVPKNNDYEISSDNMGGYIISEKIM